MEIRLLAFIIVVYKCFYERLLFAEHLQKEKSFSVECAWGATAYLIYIQIVNFNANNMHRRYSKGKM